VDGADGVYIFRNGGHQSMFIVTSDGVIATDPIAYGRPHGRRRLRRGIRRSLPADQVPDLQPHHYDHIAGGKAFKDAGATIIAHQRARTGCEAAGSCHAAADELVGDGGRVIRMGGKIVELSLSA
jgi:hypothetical protein